MRKRTKARELALQVLYQIEITKDSPEACLADFWGNHEEEAEPSVRKFAEDLVYGAAAHKEEIDAAISAAAENWHLDRMAVVDKNILRMAAYELLFAVDIPPKVSINEAIDIAKKYGDQNSSKFVNGILDNINKKQRKPIKPDDGAKEG